MKRLLSLALSVVLLLCCAAAAEGSLFTSEFEDFILKTPDVLSYTGPKADGQPLFSFYHAITGQVSSSAVSAAWLQQPDPVTAEAFSAMLRGAEPVIRSQQESLGNQLKSYQPGMAAEQELWGMPALVCDTEMTVGLVNSDISLYRRDIRVSGTFGTYIFSLSAFSLDYLEEITETLVAAVQWK